MASHGGFSAPTHDAPVHHGDLGGHASPRLSQYDSAEGEWPSFRVGPRRTRLGYFLGGGILFAVGSIFALAGIGNWRVEGGVVSLWLTNGLPLLLFGALLIWVGWRGCYVSARKLDWAAR